MTYLRKNSTIPYHLMILDNGSTDETSEIAAQLCREYREVEYVRVDQRGGVKPHTASVHFIPKTAFSRISRPLDVIFRYHFISGVG